MHSSLVLTLRHDPAVRAWLAGLPAEPAGPDTVGSARWLSGALLGGPYAGSGWRAEHGALLDVGPHVLDLLDAALGPIRAWTGRSTTSRTCGGSGSATPAGRAARPSCQLRLPIDPSEIEFAVFGGPVGSTGWAGPRDPVACYGGCSTSWWPRSTAPAQPPALDAARGLWLQELIEHASDGAPAAGGPHRRAPRRLGQRSLPGDQRGIPAAAREKPSIGPAGECTTNATASASDSLRMVCGVPPASGTTSPGPAVTRRTAPVRIADVEGELALEHVVDLARLVPVHHRWPAAGRHPDLDGEDRAAGLGPGGQHDDLVGAQPPAFGPLARSTGSMSISRI